MENMERKWDHHGEMIKALMDGQMKLAASLEGFVKETEKTFKIFMPPSKKWKPPMICLLIKYGPLKKNLTA
jgi:hypothetical protein